MQLILWRDETMSKFIKHFRKDEDGAVTVDWVVLTAAVVGLAVAAIASIDTATDSLVTATTDHMATAAPN